ncbi:MAG TPA: phosphatase PAP2-related protein [Candidatus Paceibacterota bacterium]|nr:phosphatase PAP2-related protein [Candidatus Paceibacterota bacterium]
MGKKISLKDKFNEWKKELWSHKYLVLFSLIFFVIALSFFYLAGSYTNKIENPYITDIILDNIGPIQKIGNINLTYVYVYGYLFIILLLFLYPLLYKVKELHIVIGQFSLLIMVRNFFITLTRMKTPLDAIPFDYFPGILGNMSFQNDLFFSGHTAIPFMGFLIFKGHKIRWFFLAASIICGATVLIGHMHYSIDVFSAFFITYGVYKVGEWFLKRIKD